MPRASSVDGRPGMDAAIAPHRRMLTFLILETFPKLPERTGGLGSSGNSRRRLAEGPTEELASNLPRSPKSKAKTVIWARTQLITDTPLQEVVIVRGLHKSTLESSEEPRVTHPARKPAQQRHVLVITRRHRLQQVIRVECGRENWQFQRLVRGEEKTSNLPQSFKKQGLTRLQNQIIACCLSHLLRSIVEAPFFVCIFV